MLSSFFTVSEMVKVGVEVQWKNSNFIAIGGASMGTKVPVASRKKIERLQHGTLISSPKLRIEPIATLPVEVEPHAVVLLRCYDLSIDHGWTHFALPEGLLPKGDKKRKAPVAQQIAAGIEVVDGRERSAILLALPPNSAIELPYQETGPNVLLWLGKGTPARIHKGIVKSLKRSS